MTGARPSVGSSSSSRLAPVRRMRPIASICCSPPGQLGALAAAALLQVGKDRVDLVDAHAARPHRRAAASGSPRHRGWRRCRAPPGSRRCRSRAIRFGRQADQFGCRRSAPSRVRLADDAHDRLASVVVLPAPLRPSRVTTSPSPIAKAHAVQDVRLCRTRRADRRTSQQMRGRGTAVVRHGRSPDRLRRPRDCFDTVA